ncbi:MAG: hypothetical protein N2112_03845 [Gemmataceae bacterium]|jgi:hypothetical protein|nr:hypothetical protein [Gemmataceae bacterium]
MRETLFFLLLGSPLLWAQALPDTKPLEEKGDLSLKMVQGINQYLTQKTNDAVTQVRNQDPPKDQNERRLWRKNQVEKLTATIGGVSYLIPEKRELLHDLPEMLQKGKSQTRLLRWQVWEHLECEGVLHENPEGVKLQVIIVPDAGQTPAMLFGVERGVPDDLQLARQLAPYVERIFVPFVLDRDDTWSKNDSIKRFTNQSHREFVYRMAYEMGMHPTGMEVSKIRSVLGWMSRFSNSPILLIGIGEGAITATIASALEDPEKSPVAATVSCGWFGWGEDLHKQPIDRNMWGNILHFGRVGLGRLILPRGYIVCTQDGIVYEGPRNREGRRGAAPGAIQPLTKDDILTDFNILQKESNNNEKNPPPLHLIDENDPKVRAIERWKAIRKFFPDLPENVSIMNNNKPILDEKTIEILQIRTPHIHKRQFEGMVQQVQKTWQISDRIREQFWTKVDKSSPEKFDPSCQTMRDYFWQEIIGKLPESNSPLNPKTRLIYETDKWTGYEVTLDLYDSVFCYGILCLPKNLQKNEKRPVVVCQHGLEGRPTDVCNPKEKTRYYNSFGAQLADRGYIVFAPQNPYIHQNQFRQLQRQANPLKLSLFSFIIRQHERILDWLTTLPNVDAERIGFYGLSYGGKTAMRVPAVLPKYKISICSGDFNEWIGKNVSVELPMSYMFTGEYEMFEFNLGKTFNYAEMAYMIAPRPFMVERGHDDGVGIDEMVASEYAKVRRFYTKLKIPQRTEIEFFDGGHVINGKGTFEFIEKHLGKVTK